MHHYFLDKQKLSDIDSLSISLDLRPEDIRHARAQRLRYGEHISVVDADGVYFELEILSFDKSALVVKIASRKLSKPDSFNVTLIQGISKQDKMTTILKAATELGLKTYIPCEFKRSIIRLKDYNSPSKIDRLREVARNASMQSGRCDIPDILSPVSLIDEIKELEALDRVIVFYEGEDINSHFEDVVKPTDKSIAIIIGPEGGFETSEIDTLSTLSNVSICSLGNNILRTETAGIVSVALLTNHLRRIEGL